MSINLRSLVIGDRVVVLTYQRKIIDSRLSEYRDQFFYGSIETTFVGVSTANEPIVIKTVDGSDTGWRLGNNYPYAPTHYLNERCWRIPIENILSVVGRRQRKQKPVFITCRACGSKFPWIVGTSKRSYICPPCRL
jgi:hypothetical protein